MHVRERVQADLRPCVDLLRACHLTDRYPTRWPADPEAWLSPAGLLAALVVVDQEEILGHAAVTECADPDDETVELSRLFVSPRHRRRGVGAALGEAVVDYATHLRRGLVLAVVEDGSGALDFYAGQGWRFTGRAPADWELDDGSRPTLARFTYPFR